jgi:ABC-2 type transport system ATP-binding protein
VDNSYEVSCNLSKEALADILEETPWSQIDETGSYFTVVTAKTITASDLLSLFVKHKVEVDYFRDISKSTRRLFKLEK